MPNSIKEIQTINQISENIYRFLPGTPHPYANPEISFQGVATKLGLQKLWTGGSKKPSISRLLQMTLDNYRNKFCELIIEIVKAGITYLNNKGEPISREEIINLNDLIFKLNFKIPELWDIAFLESLPSSEVKDKKTEKERKKDDFLELRNKLISLSFLQPQERGYAFEKFLNEMFTSYNLHPRAPYRMIGEQIDGSFQIGNDLYLLEAKWRDKQTDQNDLLIFREKVINKTTWGRGLLISYNGFTSDGLAAYAKGRPTNIIGMDSQDLFHILSGEMTLEEAIRKKVFRATESGEFFVSVYTLSHGG